MSKKWSASDRTRTYTYIFPMLGGNYQEFKYVINAYLYDSNNALQDKIFISVEPWLMKLYTTPQSNRTRKCPN